MDLFAGMIDAFARLIVFYVLNGVWVGAVVVVLLWGLLRFLRHIPATLHYQMVWLGLVGTLIVPFFLSSGPLSWVQTVGVQGVGVGAGSGVAKEMVGAESEVLEGAGVPLVAFDDVSHWPLYVAGVWFLVMCVFVGRLIGGAVYLRYLVRTSHWDYAVLQALFEQCKRRWTGRDVRLRFAKNIKGPMVMGVFQPVILLPENMMKYLSHEDVEQILVHELAHVARWDVLGNWIQRFIEACFWCNPFVWLLSKRLSLTREMACDDWAVRFGQGRRSYAAFLARLAQLMHNGQVSVVGVGVGASLRHRIAHLLKEPQAMGWVAQKGLWIGGGVVLGVGMFCLQLGPLLDVPGRAEAHMRLAKWHESLADFLIGNPMPRGVGLSNKIVVVAEAEHWKVLQPVFENILLHPVLTPQPEYLFEVVHALPEQFDQYRAYRNVIVVGEPDSKLGKIVKGLGGHREMVIQKDVWASHQVVMGVVARDVSELSRLIALNGDRLVSAVDEGMGDWLSSILYHAGVDDVATQNLRQQFGWQIQVPVGFDVMLDHADQQFVALSRQVERRQLWVWVYWEEGVTPDQLTPNWCLKKRNDVLETYYGGDQTVLGDLQIYETEFEGRLGVCLEGLWENVKSWQGGPFKSYALIDADRERFYMIDMGVYAPNRTKALHIRQLDALAHTFKIPATIAMK